MNILTLSLELTVIERYELILAFRLRQKDYRYDLIKFMLKLEPVQTDKHSIKICSGEKSPLFTSHKS